MGAEYRTPRFVWCEMGSSHGGAGCGVNQAAAGTASETGKGKVKKVKRTSVFAGLLDAGSARVKMTTPDACFSLVHASDAAQDIDLHLDKSAAQSRVPGAVAKRRDAWADAFNEFL